MRADSQDQIEGLKKQNSKFDFLWTFQAPVCGHFSGVDICKGVSHARDFVTHTHTYYTHLSQ